MALTNWLRKQWRRAFPRLMDMPSTIVPGDAPGIDDGVDYSQPLTLPGHVRARLEQAGRLSEWLTENARDTYRMQFDTPGRSAADSLVMPTTEDPLREWDWQTRLRVLSSCHSAYQRNPIAKRAVHYMSAFTVGDGFNLACKNDQVRAVLDAFIDNPDNAIREYERQSVRDLLVDGELFLRFFKGDGDARGQVVMVPLRPWEIQYIHTEPGFFRRPLVYRLQPYTQYNTQDPGSNEPITASDIPAAAVQHVAINRMGYELRGRPELYAALPWLRAHKEWQENRARQNHWRGALVWWVKIASALPGVIGAKVAQYQKPPTPGSTVVTSDKEEWTALTNPVGAADASEDGRQLKIMALNALGGIPEYMTGDGENANLATTKSQQLPVLMTFRELQTIMVEQVWTPVFKRVLQAAIDAGLLDAEVDEVDSQGQPIYEAAPLNPAPIGRQPAAAAPPPSPGDMTAPNGDARPALPEPEKKAKRIATLDAFTVEYEPLSTQEPYTLAQALQIAEQGGWVSKQTASTEMGYDWAQEKERIAAERQESMDAMTQGLVPTPPGTTPPGFGGDDGDAPDGDASQQPDARAFNFPDGTSAPNGKSPVPAPASGAATGGQR